MPEVDKAWFELMEFWNEYPSLKEKPATDRYTTMPEHPLGKVDLKKDDSPLLPCGREEKVAGDKQREASISMLAEQRTQQSSRTLIFLKKPSSVSVYCSPTLLKSSVPCSNLKIQAEATQLSAAQRSAALAQPRHRTGGASQLQATQTHRKSVNSAPGARARLKSRAAAQQRGPRSAAARGAAAAAVLNH
jgi:hypothetical protein